MVIVHPSTIAMRFLVVFLSLLPLSMGFTSPPLVSTKGLNAVFPRTTALQESTSLSEPEQRVYGLLEDLHESKFDFRIVVVGNGAILETTATLGPKMKLSQSPATGENLVTFASEDSSFEFHLKTAQVSKVALVEKDGPKGGRMRIMRFLNDTGKPICSLILANDSEEAAEWYKSISEKYGQEMQL
jgi:putative heme iron utilization protein